MLCRPLKEAVYSHIRVSDINSLTTVMYLMLYNWVG